MRSAGAWMVMAWVECSLASGDLVVGGAPVLMPASGDGQGGQIAASESQRGLAKTADLHGNLL